MNYKCGKAGVFTFVLSPADGGAGHQHSNPGRPTGVLNPPSLTIPCDGQWHYGTTFTAPDVAGVVTQTSYQSGVPFLFRYIVKFPGLTQLPPSPYIVPIGMSFTSEEEVVVGAMGLAACPSQHHHQDNHWGQPELIQKTLELAKKYFFRRTKKLLVNDMSLPWGGTLDFCDNWAAPHQTHRDGRHVDIQMKGVMNLDDKVAFRSIAENIFGKQHVCIDGGTHWHLVIGTTCTDSNLPE